MLEKRLVAPYLYPYTKNILNVLTLFRVVKKSYHVVGFKCPSPIIALIAEAAVISPTTSYNSGTNKPKITTKVTLTSH